MIIILIRVLIFVLAVAFMTFTVWVGGNNFNERNVANAFILFGVIVLSCILASMPIDLKK